MVGFKIIAEQITVVIEEHQQTVVVDFEILKLATTLKPDFLAIFAAEDIITGTEPKVSICVDKHIIDSLSGSIQYKDAVNI